MTKTIDLKTEKLSIDDFLNNHVKLDDLILFRHETTPKKALIFLAKMLRTHGVEKEQIKNVFNYFKNNVPLLYQEKRITDDDLTFLAFQEYESAKMLIEQKLISPNLIASETILDYDHFLNDCVGVPLIHKFNSNKLLRELLSLGADINIKSQNPGKIEIDYQGQKAIWETSKGGESCIGLTLYEIAVKNKQKGLIKSLLQILPKDNLELLNETLLKELMAEKDYKKQYKILVEAAREGNALVLDEIIKNVSNYKEALLFDGTKKINKDILHYSLEFGQKEYVQKLIDLNVFPKDNEHCYTIFGLEKKQSEAALIAFNEGYFHQENLILSMNRWAPDNAKAYNYIGSVLHENGVDIPLATLFNRSIHSFLESNFSNYKNQVVSLIEEKPYIFDIGDVKVYNNGTLIMHETNKKPQNSNNYWHEEQINVSQDKIKFVFKLLKCMFQENMDNTQYYFNDFIASINQAPEKQMMIYFKIGTNIFPEKEKEFIGQIKNETLRAKLERNLFENNINVEEDEVYQPKRKLKI